jgi:hypothetical protein
LGQAQLHPVTVNVDVIHFGMRFVAVSSGVDIATTSEKDSIQTLKERVQVIIWQSQGNENG